MRGTHDNLVHIITFIVLKLSRKNCGRKTFFIARVVFKILETFYKSAFMKCAFYYLSNFLQKMVHACNKKLQPIIYFVEQMCKWIDLKILGPPSHYVIDFKDLSGSDNLSCLKTLNRHGNLAFIRNLLFPSTLSPK